MRRIDGQKVRVLRDTLARKSTKAWQAALRWREAADRSGGPKACWPWLRTLTDDGYPKFFFGGVYVSAARLAIWLDRGPLHLLLVASPQCGTKTCVNPRHLKAVRKRVSLLGGDSTAGVNARKTHCPHGHTYDEANTMLCTEHGRLVRRCRACRSGRRHRQTAKKAAAGPAAQSNVQT